MRKIAWPGLVFAFALALGCTSTPEQQGTLGEEPPFPDDSGIGAVGTPDPGGEIMSGDPIEPDTTASGFDPGCPPPCEFAREAINDPASLLAQKIVYFDFDQSGVRGEFVDLISAHGRYLATYPEVRVRLEGHADERGSREYNVALGERRALAVRRQLLLEGVSDGQLEALSYGEELPAALGQTEEAWAKNRRVELVYQ